MTFGGLTIGDSERIRMGETREIWVEVETPPEMDELAVSLAAPRQDARVDQVIGGGVVSKPEAAANRGFQRIKKRLVEFVARPYEVLKDIRTDGLTVRFEDRDELYSIEDGTPEAEQILDAFQDDTIIRVRASPKSHEIIRVSPWSPIE
jgi:hypothetical protein